MQPLDTPAETTFDGGDTPPDFADLVERAGRGDEAALAELGRRYEPKVRVVARVLLGRSLRPYVDSVDLVQSVHRCVMIGLRRREFDLSGPDKLAALAVSIVRRKVARQWRNVQRQQRFSGAHDANDHDGGGGGHGATGAAGLLASAAGSEPAPGDAMQSREQVERLCRDLNEADRELIELRLKGLETAEIAEALSVSPVAVRVRLSRLRQRLHRERVEDDWL